MRSPTLLVFAPFLCLLLLCGCSSAQLFGFGQGQGAQQPWGGRPMGARQQCRIERLSALEPLRREQSEAGFVEYFEESNEQLQCAGVAVKRCTVEARGLVLPSYSNAPRLVYIVQGRGIGGTIYPGCPESYQSFQQTEEQVGKEATSQGPRRRDEHQKIYELRQGDVLALPAGVTHWFYNDGDSPVVTVTVFETSSSANQLDPRHREFLLAGRQQSSKQSTKPGERTQDNNNIFSGFNTEFLAEALGVDRELARKLQSNPSQQKGEIVRLQRGLQVLRPSSLKSEQKEVEEEETTEPGQPGQGGQEGQEKKGCDPNGLEESYCFMRNRENIGDPRHADVYNPEAGRLTSLNSQKLPILRFVQMSAQRGVLHRNAIHAPHWNINAHSILYALRGRCRVQVVGYRGKTMFDGELHQGQLLVIPQNYAVIKRAQSERFEWISFKTNDNAMVSQIVGKTSALRGMPLDVVANSYRISREEARRLKFNRGNELSIFNPRLEGKESTH